MTTGVVIEDHTSLKVGVWYLIVEGPPAGILTVVRRNSFLFSISFGKERIILECDIKRMSRGRALKGGLHVLNIRGTLLNEGSSRKFRGQYNPVSHKGRIQVR